VYRLVLVGVEVEDESEVFKYLWHNLFRFIVLTGQRYEIFS